MGLEKVSSQIIFSFEVTIELSFRDPRPLSGILDRRAIDAFLND